MTEDKGTGYNNRKYLMKYTENEDEEEGIEVRGN
jgi:hypothetical protein